MRPAKSITLYIVASYLSPNIDSLGLATLLRKQERCERKFPGQQHSTSIHWSTYLRRASDFDTLLLSQSLTRNKCLPPLGIRGRNQPSNG